MDYCTGRNVYWRMFWILPIPAFIAYVGTKLIQNKSKTVYKAIMAAVIVGAIVFSGRLVYNNEVFEKTSNWQKLPPSIIHMSDAMVNDWNDEGMIWVVAPQDIVGYFRQYNAQLGMAYNRWNADYKESQYILEQMLKDPIDEETLVRLCNENRYDYLILPAAKADQDALISENCAILQEMDGYVICRLPFWKNH
ncbi:MAG: hypothetical protein PHS82_03765 [Lachnospiraceae bacterium]|nr:hypothetical protein [Lachnospiraceae bacterium]